MAERPASAVVGAGPPLRVERHQLPCRAAYPYRDLRDLRLGDTSDRSRHGDRRPCDAGAVENGSGNRRKAWLVLFYGEGVAALPGLREAPQELCLAADRARRARRKPGGTGRLADVDVEGGDRLAGAGQVDRAEPADPGGEPQTLVALEPLDVEHLRALGHGEVRGLTRPRAELLEQRQSVVAQPAAARHESAELVQPDAEPVGL